MKTKKIIIALLLLAGVVLLSSPAASPMGLGNTAPVISSLTANPNPALPGGQSELTCIASDSDGEITQYEWTADGGVFPNGTQTQTVLAPGNTIIWTAPPQTGNYIITVTVYDNGGSFGGAPATATAYLTIVVEGQNSSPVISSVVPEADSVFVGASIFIVASATDPDGDPLSYQWSASGGTITGDDDADPEAVIWTAPQTAGNCIITLTVTDDRGGQSSQTAVINVVIAREAGFIRTTSANPVRVAGDVFGHIYVSDAHRDRILVYDQTGGLLQEIGGLSAPLGLTVGPDGKLYVGEDGGDRVSILSASGSLLSSLNGPPVQMPNGIEIDAAGGKTFVLDSKGAKVLVFDLNGIFQYEIDGSLAVSGGFIFPTGLGVNPASQTLYVADAGTYKIYGLDYSGNLKTSFGGMGRGEGKFSRLQGITIDGEGRIFAVDAYQSTVQVFDSDGLFLASIGTFGSGKGELSVPLDVYVDGTDRLLVTSNNNSRIEVYGLDSDVIPLPNSPPGEPQLYLPADGNEVRSYNPQLVVLPATDEDGDKLSYDFEVYELNQFEPYASASDVPETPEQISWPVQPALGENTFYEWRARAFDGVAAGPWTATRTFYVNVFNEPPAAPAETSIKPGAELRPSETLAWSASSDPDALDQVSYILEIDDDPGFNSVLIRQEDIHTTSISLESLTQYDLLQDDTLYYWRVRAIDNRGGESDWLTGSFYFNRIEIEVLSTPEGAEVFVDGSPAYPGWKPSPTITPLIIMNVKETLHIVSVHKEGYETYTAVADNRDGADDEIVAILSPAAPVELTAPIFIPPEMIVQNGTIFRSRPFLVDWNFDGRLDMLISADSGAVHLVLGGDSPSYEGIIVDAALVFGRPIRDAIVFAVDWDDDADFDLLLGNEDGSVLLALNAGDQQAPSFIDGGAVQIQGADLMPGADSAPAVLDWNDDGRKDLIVGCASGAVSLYINAGSDEAPVFTTEQIVQTLDGQLEAPGGNAVPFATDWNNDGLFDLLIGNRNGVMVLYKNVGTRGHPVFQSSGEITYFFNKNKSVEADPGRHSTPYLADWDGDGLRDLLSGNEDGEIVFFRGRLWKR